MDNLLEVCEEMGLEVDYSMSIKDRGAFSSPMKETIRAFNKSEDYPRSVTIVRDKEDIPRMKMSLKLYNMSIAGESVINPPEEYDSEDIGLIFCNGVVFSWDHVRSTAEWRSFFHHCTKEEEWLCVICETPEVPATEVVSCTTCYKWLCKTCVERLTVNKCPMCNSLDTLSIC